MPEIIMSNALSSQSKKKKQDKKRQHFERN